MTETAQSLSRLGSSAATLTRPHPTAKPRSPHPTSKTSLLSHDREAQEAEKHAEQAQREYGRGKKINTKRVKDVKLRTNLNRLESKYKDAAIKAKDAEILLEHEAGILEPEGEMEKTYRVRQSDIKAAVSMDTAKKGFELKMEDLGPYKARYSRNGRDLLLAGRKGHISTMQWRDGKLGCEIQLNETVRDAVWLHNSNSFAVAQKKAVYIYDQSGVEMHKLDTHIEPLFLEFLPYHFLLASIGNSGWLKYTDTSTGQLLAELATKQGTPTALAQNSRNAILHAGHQNGTVTLWSPNSSTPLVKILAHRGPVRSIAMDRTGHYMVSTGADSKMSVWDIRKLVPIHSYYTRQPGSSVSISDRNLTAVGWGTQMTVWRDLFTRAKPDQTRSGTPYLQWGAEGKRIENVQFCPFEDVLGIGHSHGFSSALVPGSGEPNFDASELNPYETTKQRQEAEVHHLMEKLQPGTIALDENFIGTLDLASHETRKKERDLDRVETEEDKIEKLKNRGRGRNSALRRVLRKKGGRNVIDEKRVRLEETLKKQNVREQERLEKQKESYGVGLARFARKAG